MSETTGSTPRKRARLGEILQLELGELVNGGACIARSDGYVVFVSGGAPGDSVQAEVTKSKRGYAQARVVELIQPGDIRIDPVANHPGAPWQIFPYEFQLETKQRLVDESLRRLGGLEDFQLDEIVSSEQIWRYRNKLEYSFGLDENDELTLGFHAPGRWDIIEPLNDCMLASEEGNAIRLRALKWLKNEGLSAYDRSTGEGLLRNLVVRESFTTGKFQVRLVTSDGAFRTAEFAQALNADSVYWTVLDSPGETTMGGTTKLLSGSTQLEETLCGLDFKLSPEAFFQTNTLMAQKLYETVVEFADLKGDKLIYDLFCGIGTIGLILLNEGGELWGIEQVPEAVADAITNAELNGLYNAHFYAGDVRLALPELREQAPKPDICVVDPPRAGLSKKSVRRLIEIDAERIVYVSCNPTTLAANGQQLTEAGYRLVRVRPVDMFPQTPHIECVALFVREESGTEV